ncbi:MAG TPA: hypothetical protein PLN94_02770 [Thiolinea sp.]|nr:hypothetical protein [Thiolinea sp.]
MMDTRAYHLKLTFRGPLLSQASGTLAFGVDSAMLRDREGRPVLGGSLIRGNIRETLTLFAVRLKDTDPNRSEKIRSSLNRWFGQASGNTDAQDGFKPFPGTVQFDLFWRLQGDYDRARDQLRTRIKIDATGRVEEGALQVLEDCFPLGSEPVFCGRIRGDFKTEEETALFERLMEMALDYIPAMGSFKGIGFGRLLKAELETAAQLPCETAAAGLSGFTDHLSGQEHRFGFSFTLDRPFCLGKPRIPDSNRIVSDDSIPGNVIKALLARALTPGMRTEKDQQKHLQKLQFDRWQVSHCLPGAADAGRRHALIPLSTARVKADTYHDVTDMDVMDVMVEQWGAAPEFQPDWKDRDFDSVKEKLSISAASPSRKLLVRTGIRSVTRTAEQGQLFSMECVEPDGFVWRGNIDLSRVADEQRGATLEALRKIMQEGLYGLGKTKAALINITLHPQPFPNHRDTGSSPPFWRAGETVTLTLLTPARLFRLGWERHPEAAQQTAAALYRDYWRQVSGGALELVNFFAQQERQGGAYHYHHFQRRHSPTEGGRESVYMPEWLTVAGSVFVLKIREDAATAHAKLEDWLTRGLPVPENAGDEPILCWQDSPYLPEHGYGEVTLNRVWLPENDGSNDDE